MARASRVPCRNSIGICTSKRCSARSREGRPAGCSGKPRNASPHTPRSGALACACEVIRPPKDFPPAMSGNPGSQPSAVSTAARTVACATAGGVGTLSVVLHVGKLIAQRGNAALCQLGRDRGDEGMLHPCSRAMREYVAGSCVGRRLQQPGNTDAILAGDGDGLGSDRRHPGLRKMARLAMILSPRP